MIVTRSTIIFGGVVYRMTVDARHAAALAHLAVLADRTAPQLAEIDYMHSSNLPRARCEWLRRCIASGATWAVSCDADTTFDARELHGVITRVRGPVAMGIAPVRMGGVTDSNITIRQADESIVRLTMAMALDWAGRGGPPIIEHGGFGLVVFNLAWFRANWSDPTPEGVGWERSEDIALCDAVRGRGGKLIALGVRTDHLAFGEPPR